MNSFSEKGITLYFQIEKLIREKIESGEWALGSKLPTEHELADLFGVSRTTIRHAVEGMIEAGMLIRRQGSGTYIAKSTFARNRLSTQPTDIVCKYIYTPFLLDDQKRSYKNLLLTVESHILMLHKQNLISLPDCQTLLNTIQPLFKQPPQIIGTNPLNEDCFLNFEQYMISALGVETGSQFLIARSRNDMTPTMFRLNVRDSLLKIYVKSLSLINQLLDLARQNQGQIITGYTHWQPAYPITLDYYFLSIVEALQRDFSRLLNAYSTLNLSPLGAYSFAGTSYAIDREFTAKILGFDGIILNALDAVSSRDFLLELTSCYSTMGSTLGRFAQDLYLWSTAEFGYVIFSDSTSCCSSSMPQKKNPLSIEHIKSRTSHLTAAYLDIVMCLKGTTYSHSRDLFECMPPFWNCTEQLISILDLFTDMLEEITFDYAKMKKSVHQHNLTSTELANYLAQAMDYPFRNAHGIVALAINQSSHEHSPLTLKALNAASEQLCGHVTPITPDEFDALVHPDDLISRNISEGGTSANSCKKMLSIMCQTFDQQQQQYEQFIRSLNAATKLREDTIQSILAQNI